MSVVLVSVVGVALVPTFSAQSNGDNAAEAEEEEVALFFNATDFKETGETLDLGLCGSQRTYMLTEDVAPDDRAHLGRAAAEAKSCATDFAYRETRGMEIFGPVRARFAIGCTLPIGVIQNMKSPVDLESIEFQLLLDGTKIAGGVDYVGSGPLPVTLCMNGATFAINITTGAVTSGRVDIDDILTARVLIRSVNTEPEVLEYWYLETGGTSNVTFSAIRDPEPEPPTTTTTTDEEPPPTTTTTPSPTTTTTTPSPTTGGPPPDGSPPSCQRDEPEEFAVNVPPGEDFTLRARCTDADNDLDSGEWTVDDEVVDEEELGDSPATVEREFQFPDNGTHTIRFEPTDEAGNEGTPAEWQVTVGEDRGESPPSCQREDPEEFEIERTTNQKFTLKARCTDPDNDLDSGEWRVNGERVDGEELGDSPAIVEREFFFDSECECRIDFIPKDEGGRFGPAASWQVTVTSDEASPTTTPIPFFPTPVGLALGLFGALFGAFLIFRRRPATP